MKFRFKTFKAETDGLSRFFFERNMEDRVDSVTIAMRISWSHPEFQNGKNGIVVQQSEKSEQATELLRGVMVIRTIAATDRWSHNKLQDHVQNFTHTVFVSIPQDVCRDLFYQMMNLWAQLTSCPMEAHLVSQPGYQLIAVIFNDWIVDRDVVSQAISDVLAAIAELNMDSVAVETSEEEDVDTEEELGENPDVIEHEVDPETARLIADKQRVTVTYEGMEYLSAGSVVAEEAEAALQEQSAATEVAAPPFEAIPMPYTHLYTPLNADWHPFLQVYAQAVSTRRNGAFQHLSEQWMTEHVQHLCMWCYPTPEDAYRTLLPTHAQTYTYEQMYDAYPDFEDHVRKVQVPPHASCIIEHKKYGLLIMKEALHVDKSV